ncbi:hypothetical protein J8273_1709 [Carpediemonas membranifera]|uniref:Uncharacterized protein n=1 Tax=Carpediemonas membranifera TaxID=201153 RepID=A0A8J6AWM0_9EUKA|nr:hypothetical protein J8273_1709 [Carpediemonas membranifera]|eukprot:KAG9396691.1 hypothetical protein J8273_1709 [Carpediemonas membranifera]
MNVELFIDWPNASNTFLDLVSSWTKRQDRESLPTFTMDELTDEIRDMLRQLARLPVGKVIIFDDGNGKQLKPHARMKNMRQTFSECGLLESDGVTPVPGAGKNSCLLRSDFFPVRRNLMDRIPGIVDELGKELGTDRLEYRCDILNEADTLIFRVVVDSESAPARVPVILSDDTDFHLMSEKAHVAKFSDLLDLVKKRTPGSVDSRRSRTCGTWPSSPGRTGRPHRIPMPPSSSTSPFSLELLLPL